MPRVANGIGCYGVFTNNPLTVGQLPVTTDLLLMSISGFRSGAPATDIVSAEWGDGTNWQTMAIEIRTATSGQVVALFSLVNPVVTYDRFRIVYAQDFNDGGSLSWTAHADAVTPLRYSNAVVAITAGATLTDVVSNGAAGDEIWIAGHTFVGAALVLTNQSQTVLDQAGGACNNFEYGHAYKDYSAGTTAEITGDYANMAVAVIRYNVAASTPIADSDSLAVLVTESSATQTSLANSDIVATLIDESSNINVLGAVVITNSDALSVLIAESESVNPISGVVQVTDNDSLQALLAESGSTSISGLIQQFDSDSLQVLINEDPVNNIFLEMSDDLNVLAVESGSVNTGVISVTDSDSLQALLFETEAINAIGVVTVTDSDDLRVLANDSFFIANQITGSDSLQVLISESENIIPVGVVAITASDSLQVQVIEASTLMARVSGGDSLQVLFTESDNISVSGLIPVASNDSLFINIIEGSSLSLSPTISLPVAVPAGTTTSTGSFTTDTGSGTGYWVDTLTSNIPSAAQIMSGQDYLGNAAPGSGNVAVNVTGVISGLNSSGLSSGTTYFRHYVHSDPLISNVITSSSYQTDNAIAVISAPQSNASGSTSSAGLFTTTVAAGTAYWVDTITNVQPSSAQIIAGQDNLDADTPNSNGVVSSLNPSSLITSGLTPSTQYWRHFVQVTTGNSNIVTTASYTTDTPPVFSPSLGGSATAIFKNILKHRRK